MVVPPRTCPTSGPGPAEPLTVPVDVLLVILPPWTVPINPPVLFVAGPTTLPLAELLLVAEKYE